MPPSQPSVQSAWGFLDRFRHLRGQRHLLNPEAGLHLAQLFGEQGHEEIFPPQGTAGADEQALGLAVHPAADEAHPPGTFSRPSQQPAQVAQKPRRRRTNILRPGNGLGEVRRTSRGRMGRRGTRGSSSRPRAWFSRRGRSKPKRLPSWTDSTSNSAWILSKPKDDRASTTPGSRRKAATGSSASTSFSSSGPAAMGGHGRVFLAVAGQCPGSPRRAGQRHPRTSGRGGRAPPAASSPALARRRRGERNRRRRGKGRRGPATATRGVKRTAHRASDSSTRASTAGSAGWSSKSGTTALAAARGHLPRPPPARRARSLTAAITIRPRASATVAKGRSRASGRRRANLSVGHHGNQTAKMRRGTARGMAEARGTGAHRAPRALLPRSAPHHPPPHHLATASAGRPPRQRSSSMRHFAAPSPSPGTPATRQRLDAVGTPAPCETDKTSPSSIRAFGGQHQTPRGREAHRPTALRHHPFHRPAAQRLLHRPRHVFRPPQPGNHQQPPRSDPVANQARRIQVATSRQPQQLPAMGARPSQQGRRRSQWRRRPRPPRGRTLAAARRPEGPRRSPGCPAATAATGRTPRSPAAGRLGEGRPARAGSRNRGADGDAASMARQDTEQKP